MMKSLLFLALIGVAAMGPRIASAQVPALAATQAAPAPAALTPAEAQAALAVLQDPKQRDQLIAVLKTIATAAPAAEPGAVALAPNSLGAQLLVLLSGWSGRIGGEATAMIRAMTDLPTLWRWAGNTAADPAALRAILSASGWLAAIIAAALMLEFLCRLALRRPRAALIAHLPGGNGGNVRLLRLLPLALVRLLLDLVPVALFAATGNLLAATIVLLDGRARLIVLAIVNAYAVCRAVMCVARMLVSPDDRRLRLWRLDDADARFVIAWLRRLVVIAVFGDALVAVLLLLGLDESAHDGLQRLIALALAILLVVLVIRSRREVASYIRRPGPGGPASRWRQWLAEAWPYLAVIGIVSGWIGMASGTRTGLAALYFPGVTLAAVIAARLAVIVVLGGLEHVLRGGDADARSPGFNRRMVRYRQPLEYSAVAAIAALSAIVLLQLWGASAFAWFATGKIGYNLVSALATIAIAILAAIAAWEATQALLERQLVRLGDDGRGSRSARLMTLLPILRAAMLTVIIIVVGLTALAEIGLTIAPLLAGAGIAGIALGFGSQRLVQDVITGVFVLFENAIQIGDGVTVAGLTGTIEQLSVRTIRLRASDGSVHIIPFSSVTTITNSNRGIGNAAISVTVALGEDTDRVAAILTEIAAAMRQEPDYAGRMLGEFDLLGVDAVRPWGATIAGQIVCTDTGRWPVQREFNRRMKKRFEEFGVVIAAAPGATS